MEDTILNDNNTLALYRNISSKLAELIRELEIHASCGTNGAKEELVIFKKMLENLNKSKVAKTI